MGCRSEIYVKIHSNCVEEFNKILNHHDLLEDITMCEKQDSKDFIKYCGSWLKWYELMILTANEDICCLVAIGEDGAVETWGNTSDLEVYTQTTIIW